MDKDNIKVLDAFKLKETKGHVFLDVRSPAEFESEHIKGSFNIPLDELEHHIKEFKKINKEIILICKSGVRASKACSLLHHTGMDDLKILEGGLSCWEDASLPVVKGKQKWAIERQVRLLAGFLVLIGVGLGYFVNIWFLLLSVFIGGGLMFAAITNSCGMAYVLLKLPYNKIDNHPTVENVINRMLNK